MLRGTTLRIISGVVIIAVTMIMFSIGRLHYSNLENIESKTNIFMPSSTVAIKPATPIINSAPKDIDAVPIMQKTVSNAALNQDLSDISLEQNSKLQSYSSRNPNNVVDTSSRREADEVSKPKESVSASTLPDAASFTNDNIPTPSRHILSDSIVNQEVPGYTGGSKLLPHARWKPSFDYHPHANIHETMIFLQIYYERIKGSRNQTTTDIIASSTPESNSPPRRSANSKSSSSTKTPYVGSRSVLAVPEPQEAAVSLDDTSYPVYEDYTDRQLTQLVHCGNQTTCTAPLLQLQRNYNVYFCKHIANGVRFYYLVREGLLLHPKIHLVEDMFQADVIVYLPESARWHRSECRDPRIRHKIVVLDEGDGPQMFVPPVEEDLKFLQEVEKAGTNSGIEPPTSHKQFLLYFKRSYVRRDNGIFHGYMPYVTKYPNILPMFYPVATAYLRHPVLTHEERDLEIVCSLRGSNWDPTRQRIKEWTQEYVRARQIPKDKVRVGEVNSESRTTVSKGYFQAMYSSKIVVTSNPSHWEGDFRLMEAMASAALVFVDDLYVPRPSIPLHGQHIVYYDNMNKVRFFELLDQYRAGFSKKDSSTSGSSPSSLRRISSSVPKSHRFTDVDPSGSTNKKSETNNENNHNFHLRGTNNAAHRRLKFSFSNFSSSLSFLNSHPNNDHAHVPVHDHSQATSDENGREKSGFTLSDSERIAYRGYIHSLRFLRTDSLIDYVFRSLHIFELEHQEALHGRIDIPAFKVHKEGNVPTKVPPKEKEQFTISIADPSQKGTGSETSTAQQNPQVTEPTTNNMDMQENQTVSPRKPRNKRNRQRDTILDADSSELPPKTAKAMRKRRKSNDMMREVGFELQFNNVAPDTRRHLLRSISERTSLDALGRIAPEQRNFRVSKDRKYGTSALYGYNSEHGFAMRWRAIPMNGNPTKATGVIAPGSQQGSKEILLLE